MASRRLLLPTPVSPTTASVVTVAAAASLFLDVGEAASTGSRQNSSRSAKEARPLGFCVAAAFVDFMDFNGEPAFDGEPGVAATAPRSPGELGVEAAVTRAGVPVLGHMLRVGLGIHIVLN